MLQCNETDALLQVKYNITKEEWDSLQRKFSGNLYYEDAFLYLQREGNTTDNREYLYYKGFERLTDYEACLPRDSCSEVVVGDLPSDAYEISFDGKAVDIGQELLVDGNNSVTSTGIGACTKPICNDSEALLEIQYWNGQYDLERYYRVEDKDGKTVLSRKPNLGYRFVDRSYACLPKDDACYKFLIGGLKQSDLYRFPSSSYSVTFDGKLVGRSDRWLFDGDL